MHSLMLGSAIVLGTIALACAVYFAMRAVAAKSIGEDTPTMAHSVLFRVAATHGLILALVVAQMILSFQELRSTLVQEATAIADIYNDIGRYGTDAQADVQSTLAKYVRVVIEVEWGLLASEGRLSDEGWKLREVVYIALLDLEPSYCQKLCMGLSCGGAILAFSIHEFDASNDLGELI